MDNLLELPPIPSLENTTTSSAPYCTSTLESLDELKRFEKAWRDFDHEGAGPIEQYDWIRSCAENDCGGENLAVVVVTLENRLVAAVPLFRTRLGGIMREAALGVDKHYEPMDFHASDELAMSQLAESLAGRCEPLVISRIPASSPALAALRRAFAKRGLVVTHPRPAAPFIPLDSSWSNPEMNLNSGRRSDFRRAQRNAEAMGRVTWEILTPEPEQLDHLLDEAFAVESRSWKGDIGTALACDSAQGKFNRDYAHAACRAGILRMGFLRIEGCAVAMQLAIVADGAYWLLKIGFDPDYGRASPGILLLRESIAYAARQGLKTFEFLGVPESWIDVWTKHKRPCVIVRTYPYNLRGAAALAVDVGTKAAKLGREKIGQAAAKLWTVCRAGLKTLVLPVMKRLSRNYIAGDSLADARRVCRRLSENGIKATIGFWDAERDKAQTVAGQYLAGLDAMAEEQLGSYLSIKLPALRYSDKLLAEIVARSQAAKTLIRFDAMAPDTVDRTWLMIDEVLMKMPEARIGCTLPGRWLRSVADASWAAKRGLPVRVVKGQWVDPDAPTKDMNEGYLEVIDALAGKASYVSVATHDPLLAEEAVRRLQAAGTMCDLELLYGLPMRKCLAVAQQLDVAVRVYVPYGEAYMPYTISKIRENPRIVTWLIKDMFARVFANQKLIIKR